MKRKVRIRVTRIRNRTADVRTYCRACGCETEVVTVADAEDVLQIGSDTLSSLILAGIVHSISTVTGSLCICKRSIFAKNGFT